MFTTIGIVVGGLWAYYVFVKGRTFTPKLAIDISKHFVCGENNDIIFLKCVIKNSGRIKITPNYVSAQIYYCKFNTEGVKYVLLEKKDNILHGYTFKEDENIYLEPMDSIDIYFEVLLDDVDREIKSNFKSNPILLVKIAFVDYNIKVWQKSTTLLIEEYLGKEDCNG